MFVLFQPRGDWWHEYADAREIPEDQKKKPVSQLPPGKYSLTASHILDWKGSMKLPENWYDPVTTNAVEIEILAKP